MLVANCTICTVELNLSCHLNVVTSRNLFLQFDSGCLFILLFSSKHLILVDGAVLIDFLHQLWEETLILRGVVSPVGAQSLPCEVASIVCLIQQQVHVDAATA